jgi:O-antigen ligase
MLLNDKLFLGKLLSLGSLATLLIVTPSTTLDPINVPKYAVLVLTAGISLAMIIRNHKEIRKTENRLVVLVSGVFLLMLFSAFIASKINPWAQLFGVFGRNTGLITYLSLLTLFLAAALLTTKGFESTYSKSLLVGGVASTLYGLLQTFEFDPADWVNSYSPVIGFLGNPNFQSSFIGMSCVVAVSLMLHAGSARFNQLSLLAYTLVALFVISRSDAQQGYLVFLAGLVSVFGIYIWQSNLKKLFIPYLILSIFGFVVAALGILNRGLLASVLYKDSVTFRGDYWRAGWKITLESPIFGIGLDGYGDWYRRARTVEATLRRGPDVISNAAHNVLLDLSSNGGFPLLIAYLALLALVVAAIVKTLKSGEKFDSYFTALVGAWIGYNAQSIISLNQIGLAIWGWILGGAIIGYSRYGAEKISKSPVRNSRSVSAASIARTRIAPASAVAVFLGLVLGAGAGMPPYLASQEFRQAFESGDAIKVENAAYIWPLDPSRLVQVAIALNENKLESQGLAVALDAVESFPDNFSAWAALFSMKSATEGQKAQAVLEMKRLDPHNPELK